MSQIEPRPAPDYNCRCLGCESHPPTVVSHWIVEYDMTRHLRLKNDVWRPLCGGKSPSNASSPRQPDQHIIEIAVDSIFCSYRGADSGCCGEDSVVCSRQERVDPKVLV